MLYTRAGRRIKRVMTEAGPRLSALPTTRTDVVASPAALIGVAAALLVVGWSLTVFLEAIAAPNVVVHTVLYGMDTFAAASLGVAATTAKPPRDTICVEQFDEE